jgi:hypothetical protein
VFAHPDNEEKKEILEVIERFAAEGDFEALQSFLGLMESHGVNLRQLAQHFEEKMIHHGNVWPADAKSAKEKYKKIVELILPYCKNEESKGGDNPSFSYDYNRQVYIDFNIGDNSKAAQAFKSNWDRGHAENPCMIIEERDFLERRKRLKYNPNHVVRIYIEAHCNAGFDFVRGGHGGETDIEVHYEKMAECLNAFIGKSTAVVNLISCAAGRGSTNTKIDDLSMASFGSKLHHSLVLKAGRDIPVVARAQSTSTYVARTDMLGNIKQAFDIDLLMRQSHGEKKSGGKRTFDLNLTIDDVDYALARRRSVKSIHHQPGSKLIFMLNADGKQIVIDAYTYSWKEKVRKALIAAQSKTVVEDKKALINAWLQKFEKMTPKEIFDCIYSELKNPNSVFAKHQPGSAAGFFVWPKSFQALQALIKEAEPYFDSEFTLTRPMLTGRAKK